MNLDAGLQTERVKMPTDRREGTVRFLAGKRQDARLQEASGDGVIQQP